MEDYLKKKKKPQQTKAIQANNNYIKKNMGQFLTLYK